VIKNSLSIVIPCYKIDKNVQYLNLLLKSINNQYKNSFNLKKIILINDSPEFKLEDYIEPLLLTNNLIIKNNLVNSGQAFSRNIGLNLVTTEYVHFIDQDDFLNTSFYLNMQPDADILISKCVLAKKNLEINHAKFSKNIWLSSFRNINKLKFFLLFDNIILSPGQAVFKAKIIRSINGFPELKCYGSDDYGLMFKLAKYNYSYKYFKDSLYFHRLHEIQGKQFLNMRDSRKEFLNHTNSFFNWLCKVELFPFSILKKILYVFFYNRL
jgi:hypothetical protein